MSRATTLQSTHNSGHDAATSMQSGRSVVSRVAPTLRPTRAQALVASGLLDLAVGIEDLSGALADAVAYELNGFVSHWQIRSAIRRAIGDLLNSHDGATDAKSAQKIILERALERSRDQGEAR